MSFLVRTQVGTCAAVLRDLASSDPRVRKAAIAAAPRVAREEGDEARLRIIEGLVAQLSTAASTMIRGDAALALADLEATEAVPQLIEAATDDNDLLRELAVSALGEIGDGRAAEVVGKALRDDEPEVRFQAIVAYPRVAKGQIPEDRIWAALRRGLDDADGDVQVRAAEACAELADGAELPAAIGDRLANLCRDEGAESELRIVAAITLGDSGDARGGKVLVAVITGELPSDERRTCIAMELAGELRLETAKANLEATVFGWRARFGDPTRRTAALVALCRLGDARAIAEVTADLESGSYAKKAIALGVAGRGKVRSARAAIEGLRGQPGLADPDAVEDALAALDA